MNPEARFDPRAQMPQRGELVTDNTDCTIKPSDIDTSTHLSDAYGNYETEISAWWIIRMCQEKHSWAPFSRSEIEEFYQKGGMKDGFTFNQLVRPGKSFFIREGNVPFGGGWIVEKDRMCYLTTAFIEAAYKSSPKKPQAS